MSAVPLHPENPPALDATTVARAFEVLLPARTGGMALSHNSHKDGTPPEWGVLEEILSEAADNTPLAFISDVEKQKAVATNELWILYWRPKNADNDKHTRICAASLPAIAQWLQDQGLAFGS